MRSKSKEVIKLFFQLSGILALAFSFGMGVARGFLVPFIGWVFDDVWQWEPFSSWLRFVVLGGIVGVIAGAFFTTHAWLTERCSSMLRRIVTTAAVVTTCIAVVVFARDYLGRVLPG